MPGIYVTTLKSRGVYLKDDLMVEFSKSPTSWKILLERMIGNVFISEINDIYVVLGKAEKHESYGQLLGATKYMTL